MSPGIGSKSEKRKRAAISALVLAIAAIIWWNWLTAAPTFDIPTPRAPTPNAYDIYRAAGLRLVDTDSRPLTHDKLIDIAFEKVDPKLKMQLVAINQSALANARRAFQYTYINPIVDTDTEAYRNYRTQLIAIARLFVWNGDVSAKAGNLTEAAQCYLDALQFGNQTGYSVALNCDSAARRGLWAIANRLSQLEARRSSRQTGNDRQEPARICHFAPPAKDSLPDGLPRHALPPWISAVVNRQLYLTYAVVWH